jgi:hypothetical protein
MPTGYSPAPPSIDGTAITLETWLNNPARVTKALEDLSNERFLADRVFSAGPTATAGAVVYDQVTEADLYTTRDVQSIGEGAPFPMLGSGDTAPKVALVTKWGGAIPFSYEAVRRDRRDLLGRGLVKIRNSIVRKVDTVGIAALHAAPTHTMAASGDWTTAATDIISDIETGRSTVEQADLGYEVTAAIIHPAQALDLRKDADIRAALPRENMAANMLGARDLSGFLRIPNWYVSNRQTAGTVDLLAEREVGSISDELPLYSRTIDEPLRERYVIQGARIPVPYVTDPKAAVKITGA